MNTYMKRNLSVLFVFSFVLSSLSSSLFVSAQEPDTSVQAQCFATLKENMKEVSAFSVPLNLISTTTYTDISSKFGPVRKTLQSFDITVDKNILGIRLYSFGNQTGYVHPPKSVLPVSSKSETWGDSIKEYIIAEEYITDQQGKEHFTNCLFLQVASDNLLQVTQDNYAYDMPSISLTKDIKDGQYKTWYNEITSFNYQNKPFVTWKKLFVYPKATQNTYFNRYDVFNTYPTNKVTNFNVLDFFFR